MSSKELSEFSPQWCQDLLHSPALINITTETRRPRPPTDIVIINTLFSKTLNTDATVRAYQVLVTKGNDPFTLSLLLSLDTGLESYKGFLHGGMSCAILDQACGTCAIESAGPTAVTADASFRFKQRIPLPTVILCRAIVTKWVGRKIWIEGFIEDGNGVVFCEAKFLFVTAKQEKL